MIRRLIILLLIVGCEKDSPTESSVDPLVGVWEATDTKITYTSGTLNGTTLTFQYGENTEYRTATWIMGADGVASMSSTGDGVTESDSGTWSSTGNKITIITNCEDGETVTQIYDFVINGNILTIYDEYDGTAAGEYSYEMEISFTKQ